MVKILKFSDPLPELILKGQKTITWRINDDKNITTGDELSLCRKSDLKEFARAKAIAVKTTTFGDMTEEDRDGHEEFGSENELYHTYTAYYKFPITPETKVKVIKFQLIS